MKKFLATLISGIVISSLTPTVNAQQASISTEAAIDNTTANASLSKANTRAANDFKKHYADGPDVKWINAKETITAGMNREGKNIRVVYNRKGRWLHTMTVYDETKLRRDLRKLVKTTYFDFDIKSVQEIHEGSEVFYVFHLEDSTDYKQVSLYDGEFYVLKEFKKQK